MNFLLAELSLARPWWSVLLLLAAPVLLLGFARWGRSARPHWWLMVGCRGCAVVLLGMAAAGLQWNGASARKQVTVVLDRSASARDARPEAEAFLESLGEAAPGHDLRFLSFGETPARVRRDHPEWDVEQPAGTDAAAALRLAAAESSGGNAELVLMSDGGFAAESALRAALELGLPISTVPLPRFNSPEAAIESLHVVPRGSAAPRLLVAIRANRAGPAVVSWRIHGAELEATADSAVELVPGVNPVAWDLPRAPRDSAVIVELRAEWDTFAENNRRTVRLPAAVQRKMWRVGRSPAGEEGMPAFGSAARDIDPRDLATALRRAECDLLILNALAPDELAPEAWGEVERAVRDEGMGLAVFGGERVFGREKLAGSRMETLLPVRAWEPTAERVSSLALLMVIDNSSSMLEENRMELAKQAAQQTIELLAPTDQVGLLAFSTDAAWISPLALCDDKPGLRERIAGLRAYGSTNMYPALLRAQAALEQARADRRLLIVLTDGVSTPGDFAQLAREMARSGIAISTVSVSEGADQTILRDMAALAGGRHYHCDDPREIPAILVRETRSAAQPSPEEVRSLVLRRLPGLALDAAPPVTGHAPTEAKPQAEVLAAASQGEPLLAWWRFGAGAVVVFSGNPSEERWTHWAEQAGFWSGLEQLAARRREPDHQSWWEIHERRVRFNVELFEAYQPIRRTAVQLRARWQGPGAAVQEQELVETAPGRYALDCGRAEIGEYRVAVVEVEGDSTEAEPAGELLASSFFHDYPAEYAMGELNEKVLRRIAAATGGRFQPRPEELFSEAVAARTAARPLWRELVMLALVVLLGEAGIRRWGASAAVNAEDRPEGT